MKSIVPKNFRLLLSLILAGAWPASIYANQGISSEPIGLCFKTTSIPIEALAADGELLPQNPNQAMVLQKCLDLEALQAYYPKDKQGACQQIYVLQHGVSFPTDMEVSVAGKPLVFINKSRLAKEEIQAYFLFYEFAITGNTARVDFVYNYDQTSQLKKMLVVSLQLQKTGSTWNIVEQKTEERES